MRRSVAAATASLLVAPAAAQAAKQHYRAEVRRTTGGWAHVKANNYGSLGFGYGYAYAQDQICELADIVTTVNAERSRYFGPARRQPRIGLLLPAHQGRADGAAARSPARAARAVDVVRATVKGFAAGYNAYLRKTGRAKLPDPTAAARPGCARSRRWTCTGASTSSACAPARATSSREIVAAKPPPPARPPRRRGGADPQAFAKRLDPAGWARTPTASVGRRARRALARARQPALPVAGLRALVPAAPDDPRQARRDRRGASGRPGREHRLQPRRRVEPHGLDRAPVHAVRADLVKGKPTHYR